MKGNEMGEIKTEHTCKTCEHKNDSGIEYCGVCDGAAYDNWTEAGWHIEERLQSKIGQQDKLLRYCLAIFGAEPDDATIAIPQITKEIERALKETNGQ